MSMYQGGCLCGGVRYSIGAAPLVARLCWCRTCQKIAGNGTANAIFPTDSVTVTGTLATFTSVADSGNTLARHFCPTCGCHLLAASSATPQYRVVRLGTLDEPSAIAPSLNIWTASAPAWACLDPKLEAVAGQPRPPQGAR